MPREISFPHKDFFSLYDRELETDNSQSVFDLELVSRILLLTYTISARARHAGANFFFRSAASAGALYPTEIYILSNGIKDLQNGLYHFAIPEHRLVTLREGDLSRPAKNCIRDAAAEDFPLIIYFTAIFFRSAWKYRDRAYRYHLLDTGHVLENLDLSMKALGLSSEILYDFDDNAVNHLLGLDDKREVTLAVCRLRGKPESQKASEIRHNIGPLPENMKHASRVSPQEFDLFEIWRAHAAGYDETAAGAEFNMCKALGITPDSPVSVPRTPRTYEVLKYPEVVFSRRSSRNFINKQLPFSSLSDFIRVLLSAGESLRSDYFKSICSGFLTKEVEAVENGFYVIDREKMGFRLAKPGDFTETMSQICLNQEWMANASLHFLFMVNMDSLERSWGARGYRYAMMLAGILGERLYLAATAMGLGCCGIGAFYDQEASQLLNLNSSSGMIYLVSTGIVKSIPKRDSSIFKP